MRSPVTGTWSSPPPAAASLPRWSIAPKHVLFIVGAQKVVTDLEAAMRRIHEYSLPLEDARARSAYRVGSAVHKVLIVHGDIEPGRVHVLLVDQPLGF
jgi:LUD domain